MSFAKKFILFLMVLFSFGVISQVGAEYTGSVDYVAAASTVGDGQYSAFIDLVNSPIGYLLMFVLGVMLLKWMGGEIKGFTPGAKRQ